jgi:hypothetical protein
MRRLISIFAFLGFATLTAAAQQTNGAPATTTPQATAKPHEEKTLILTPPKTTNAVLAKPVIYGGFFTELIRAESKRAFFDLRTPLDPQKDLENVLFYPGTQQVQGIILVSIKF